MNPTCFVVSDALREVVIFKYTPSNDNQENIFEKENDFPYTKNILSNITDNRINI